MAKLKVRLALVESFREHVHSWEGCTRCKIGEWAGGGEACVPVPEDGVAVVTPEDRSWPVTTRPSGQVGGTGIVAPGGGSGIGYLNEEIVRDGDTVGVIKHHHVFARGQLPCDVLFVGEGPGKVEDREGYPFVGPAGGLLDEWIESAGVGRVRWCITNLVLCRPCDSPWGPNRPATVTEESACRPRLQEFLALCGARAYVLLGAFARDAFSGTTTNSVGQSVQKLALYHPAYILRNGGSGSLSSEKCITQLKHFIDEVCNVKAIETR